MLVVSTFAMWHWCACHLTHIHACHAHITPWFSMQGVGGGHYHAWCTTSGQSPPGAWQLRAWFPINDEFLCPGKPKRCNWCKNHAFGGATMFLIWFSWVSNWVTAGNIPVFTALIQIITVSLLKHFTHRDLVIIIVIIIITLPHAVILWCSSIYLMVSFSCMLARNTMKYFEHLQPH